MIVCLRAALFTARLSFQGVHELAPPGSPPRQKRPSRDPWPKVFGNGRNAARFRGHQNPSELGSALGPIERFACVKQQSSRLAEGVAGYVEAERKKLHSEFSALPDKDRLKEDAG